MDAEVAAEVQSEDETFFGFDIDIDSVAEWQPSSPAAMRLKVADDLSESEDEESSPEINSESGAIDGSDVLSSAVEEEIENKIAERLHAGCSCEYVDHFSARISYSLSSKLLTALFQKYSSCPPTLEC